MKINIITIFPDFFISATNYSIIKRAQDKHAVEFHIINLRDFTSDNYHTVDDRPFGGGAGMVMMVEPLYKALNSLNGSKNIVLPSAQGKVWTQSQAQEFSDFDELTFIVPHFEGVDHRVVENLVDYEISVGQYVLSGGELPTMTIIDSIVRLIPGVLGNPESIEDESFSNGDQLEYPQYTRPASFKTDNGEEWSVPEVLLSGNHKEINEWRENNRRKI